MAPAAGTKRPGSVLRGRSSVSRSSIQLGFETAADRPLEMQKVSRIPIQSLGLFQ
jgi:hypothetical protein